MVQRAHCLGPSAFPNTRYLVPSTQWNIVVSQLQVIIREGDIYIVVTKLQRLMIHGYQELQLK